MLEKQNYKTGQQTTWDKIVIRQSATGFWPALSFYCEFLFNVSVLMYRRQQICNFFADLLQLIAVSSQTHSIKPQVVADLVPVLEATISNSKRLKVHCTEL